MKKLKKLMLSPNSKKLEDSEMKMITGGYDLPHCNDVLCTGRSCITPGLENGTCEFIALNPNDPPEHHIGKCICTTGV